MLREIWADRDDRICANCARFAEAIPVRIPLEDGHAEGAFSLPSCRVLRRRGGRGCDAGRSGERLHPCGNLRVPSRSGLPAADRAGSGQAVR